jgi:type IV pilus assembly protein PilN
MIDVDLLPPDEVRLATEKRHVRIWCACILAAAVVSVATAHGAVEVAAAVTGRRLARLEAQLAGLRRPAAALGHLRQRRAALDRRLRTIANLEARSGEMARLLAALAAATPERLWLSELSLLDGRLRMSGFATDEQTIATFLASLREHRPFHDVDLDEAARDDRAPPGARRFVVSGQVGTLGGDLGG